MLKAVLFDFGGTLDCDGEPWLDRFARLYLAAGLRAGPDELRGAFYDADDRLSQRFRLEGLDLAETVLLQAGCVVERLDPGNAGLARAVASRFVEDARAQISLNLSFLERLRGRYRLGIVSNFYGNLEGLIRREGLGHVFEAIADSGRLGVLKPDPALFLHAADRLGALASECLMVGDSLGRDMRGAEAAGMPHAWIVRDPSATPCCPVVRKVRRLRDLEPFLCGGAA